MPNYRPASPGPLSLPCGVWTAPGLPDRTLTISIDPRLLTWFVKECARRPTLTMFISNGKPPTKIQLT